MQPTVSGMQRRNLGRYIPSSEKQYSCRKIRSWEDAKRPIMKHSLPLIFLHGICVSRKDFTSSKEQNHVACFSQMFYSIHMKGILHIYHYEMICFFQKVLHVLLHVFQSNGSLPCAGSFVHTCILK